MVWVLLFGSNTQLTYLGANWSLFCQLLWWWCECSTGVQHRGHRSGSELVTLWQLLWWWCECSTGVQHTEYISRCELITLFGSYCDDGVSAIIWVQHTDNISRCELVTLLAVTVIMVWALYWGPTHRWQIWMWAGHFFGSYFDNGLSAIIGVQAGYTFGCYCDHGLSTLLGSNTQVTDLGVSWSPFWQLLWWWCECSIGVQHTYGISRCELVTLLAVT